MEQTCLSGLEFRITSWIIRDKKKPPPFGSGFSIGRWGVLVMGYQILHKLIQGFVHSFSKSFLSQEIKDK